MRAAWTTWGSGVGGAPDEWTRACVVLPARGLLLLLVVHEMISTYCCKRVYCAQPRNQNICLGGVCLSVGRHVCRSVFSGVCANTAALLMPSSSSSSSSSPQLRFTTPSTTTTIIHSLPAPVAHALPTVKQTGSSHYCSVYNCRIVLMPLMVHKMCVMLHG